MTLAKLSNQMPSIFDRFLENDFFDWSNKNFSDTNTTLPAVNIKESENNFEVEMAAPGLKKKLKTKQRKKNNLLKENLVIKHSAVHLHYPILLRVKKLLQNMKTEFLKF